MPITRQFIDPKIHALQAAAEFLFGKYAAGRTADLSNVVVALPGGRAGRRLLEILVDVAADGGLAMIPPEITTVGSLPERLYRPQRPFANEMTQQLTWAKALAAADRAKLTHVIGNPPDEDDIGAWRHLGDLLRRTHLELAADGLDFNSAAEATHELREADETRRWQILRDVQRAYLELLDKLALWDRQTARLVAIKERECSTDRQIVLLGTVDINQALRKMLDQVAQQVTALIPAPQAWADRFDEHGCLRPDAWHDAEITVPDDRIRMADDPADVAENVIRCIARFSGRYRADEITVGVADERIVPQLERVLEQHELPARYGPGRSISETGPYRLLEAVARYVDDGRYEDFAALVRHPDLFAWLQGQGIAGDWLTELDKYFGSHLPAGLDKKSFGGRDRSKNIAQVQRLVDQLTASLRGAQRPLGEWTDPLVELVAAVYGDRQFDRENASQRSALTACNAIHTVLAEQVGSIPRPLMPKVSAGLAVSIALDRVRAETIPAPADRAAIELVGWLELPLDDAPAMVVTSFNEGFVPKSINADLLLPDGLRRRLGVEDNARRYARDAYALSVILAAREDVDLIVARRNSDHDPMAPSRLLFATDRETIARRALRFFDDPPPAEPRPPAAAGSDPVREEPVREEFDFPYLKPEKLPEPITSLSPTGFRSYLSCPYRFYLQRVLRLESLADNARELDGAAFGNLLHETLRRFGESEHRDSTDADEIRRVLNRHLDDLQKKTYGAQPLAAVRVQVEQARMRLNAFAERQAEWAQEWRIEHTELYIAEEKAPLMVDGEPFYLRGQVDRVDVHCKTGERAILDYKSSDTASTPDKAHRRSGEWIDLQLPLYRHLVRAIGVDGPVKLGYVQLPRDVGKVEFRLAEWTADELREADETATEVIRRLRDQVFWPPADPPPLYSEEFAWICHDGVFDKPAYGP